MSKLYPIQAIRPQSDLVEQIVSPPYDVMNREEASQMAKGNPLSFLRVSRAEIDLPDLKTVYSQEVYDKAAENWKRLQENQSVLREESPSLYVYRLKMGEHVQVGIAGGYSIQEYEEDKILKHEKTRQVKEDDRTNHMLSIEAQTGPVFLTYRDETGIAQWTSEYIKDRDPLYHLVTDDKIEHTLWRVEEPAALVERFSGLKALYIADGHHRAASSWRAAKELEKKGLKQESFLAVAFPDEQMQILAYHRVLRRVEGFDFEKLLSRLGEKFAVRTLEEAPESVESGRCVVATLDGGWHEIDLRGARQEDKKVAWNLTPALVEREILASHFGVQDIRTDERVDFVGGIRGVGFLKQLLEEGRAQMVIVMPAVLISELEDISDQGDLMPPKSTWFEPKLRDGFLSQALVGAK